MDDRKLEGCGFICLEQKILFENITKEKIRNMQDKQDYVMITDKHDKNNVFVVNQSKIAENESKKVHLAIK